MPKKPQKLGIKVCSLVHSKHRYVYEFDIYCKRNGGNGGDSGDGGNGDVQLVWKKKPILAYKVFVNFI
jgi:hypothetical protein